MLNTLKQFESEDSRALSLCARTALEELVAMKADVPQLSKPQQRFDDLYKETT
jgi:hypothetical protein